MPAADSSAMQVTTPNDTDLVLTRSFDAPREQVFAACTRPELMMRWFALPGHSVVTCEEDQRVGGHYRWVMRGPDGTESVMKGQYKEFAAPERVAATQVKDTPGGETEELVTSVFTEVDGRTTLTCTVSYPSRDRRDAVMASGLTSADAEAYDRLQALLHSQGR